MGVQNPLFETPVALDFPRQLDEIQCPKPFDVGFRPDVVNHHLADDLANASKVGVATIRRVDRLITTRERSRNNVLKDRERRRQNAAQSAKIEQARMKPATADKADRIKGGKILPWNIIVHGN
jgi:hypothetical protein